MWAASRTTSQMGQGHRSPQGSQNRRQRPQVGCQAQAYPEACHGAHGRLACLHMLPSFIQQLTLRPLPPCARSL